MTQATSKTINRTMPFLVMVLSLILTLCAQAVLAQGAALQEQRSFDISASTVADALKTFAIETDSEILFTADIVQGKSTQGVQGQYTDLEALEMILANTGLNISQSDDDIYMIRASDEQETSSGAGLDAQGGAEKKPTIVGRVEEIIVTAQKRGEQSLQEVPISMSVLGGADLDSGSFEGVNDALSQVAGLQLYENPQNSGTKISLRGVTSNTSIFSGSSVIGYYLDDVSFGFAKTPFSPDASAYDMERVEVLRGPQGTLYGASALIGVVRVLTNDANLDDFEFKARTSLSSTDGGGENHRGDMAINLPIVPGKLAIRGVFGYNDLSGWIEQPNNPGNSEDANDAELANYRLKIKAQPTEDFSAELSVWVSRDDRGAPTASDDDGNWLNTQDEPISTDYEAYGLTLEHGFPAFTVTSATSYINFENVGYLDIAAGADLLTTDLSAEVFSEELRLTSNLDGSWQWSLGAMIREAKDRTFQDLPVFWPDLPLHSTDKSESFAVFGDLTKTFLDGEYELSVGLRYFEDEVSSIELGRGGQDILPADLISTESKFDAVTPRVVLSWLPTDEFTAYASYSQGFRSGFDALPFFEAAAGYDIPPVVEDLLTNYEIGAKGSLSNRLSYEAALYYVDWEDTQQRLFVSVLDGAGIAGIPLNGETVNGLGLDLSVTAALTDSFEIGATFSKNDLSFANDVESAGLIIFEKGDRIDESPETTFSLTADYVFPLGQGGYQGHISASANYHSELTVTDGQSGVTTSGDSITQFNLRLTVEAPENWTASLYVDNLTNEDGVVRPVSGLEAWSSRLRPRTAGLQFEYQY